MTAQPEPIDLLNTEVKGDVWGHPDLPVLDIRCEFTVHIVTPSLLNSIEVHGSSDVLSDDVFGAGHTDLSTGGSGSITISVDQRKGIGAENLRQRHHHRPRHLQRKPDARFPAAATYMERNSRPMRRT
ncbi:MAG: hypothetical protein IPH00_00015 [Flavobacteriales bacterium]|nr:hypothetical protein [Flavobacteriales bacterium]